MVGDEASNIIRGREQDEWIQGQAGEDRLFGNAGNDQMHGGAGDDHLRGGWGRDQLWGGEGDDYLFGGDHGDRLYGDDGADHLRGGHGNDVLTGGMGQDWLTGGAGSDRFVYTSVDDGGDEILDFNAVKDLIDVHKIWRGVASEFTEGLSLSLSDIFDQFVRLTSAEANAVRVGVNVGADDEPPTYLATLQGVSTDDLSVSNFIF